MRFMPTSVCRLLQMCADGGALSDRAMAQLASASYSQTLKMEGGYKGWTDVSGAQVGNGGDEPVYHSCCVT